MPKMPRAAMMEPTTRASHLISFRWTPQLLTVQRESALANCIGHGIQIHVLARFARAHLGATTQHSRLLRRLPALSVRENNPPPTQAIAKHAIFGFQVLDRCPAC